jgi:hypothetical protein
MTHFSVGDRVLIRYGKHQGQKANILKRPEAHVYKVKAEDGFILYYSEKGLEKEGAYTAPARLVPVPLRSGLPMTPTKTLRQREQELQSLLVTPAGQKDLQHLDSQYQAKSGRLRAGKASVITYILVHERAVGLIRS